MRRPLPGWLKLLLSVAFLWFFLGWFTPFWVSFSPLHQKFAAAQDDLNVPIGALYYNDLPFINEATMVLRDTWRFLPRGGKASSPPAGNASDPQLAPAIPATPETSATPAN